MENIKCDHCHLSFSKDVMIEDEFDGKKVYFCCKGCQGVYHLLKNEGLDSFYDKLGNNTLSQPVQTDDDTAKFDLESFEKEYVKITKDGFKSIDLIIEGIHCAACVWLNEKVLYDLDGIVEASINFTNNKAKVIWDDDIVKLSKIIETIRAIGYNAYPYTASLQEEKAKQEKQDYFTKLMVAIFGAMNIMMLVIGKYSGYFTGLEKDTLKLMHFGEVVLATPVLLYSGSIFYKNAYYGLKNKFINMDFLVITGATLTYLYSLYAISPLSSDSAHTYFDSSTMIIAFVMLGKYLEIFSKKAVSDSVDSIKNQIPTEVTIIENDTKKIISPKEVKENDIIELKSGQKAVIDGVVISGSANFDESSISGESDYIHKKVGDTITSGTINIDGAIRYKASKDFQNSLLNHIVTLLEDSIHSKPQIEQLANTISGKFSLTILLLSVGTFFGWYLSGHEFERSFVVAISVIVIACPCALALATPVASILGIGQLTKDNILFKEAKHIETLAKSNTIVFDKTGTLTNGELKVSKVDFKNKFDINILYSLVSLSTHPISQSIKKYIQENYQNLHHLQLSEFTNIEAKGIKAKYDNKTYFGGNLKLLQEQNLQAQIDTEDSIFLFFDQNKLLAVFELKDTLKTDAKESITKIQSLGLHTIMLTGDNQAVASKIAKEVGIDEYYSEQNPINKAEFIKKLKSEDKVVIMVGDGINDSVALANSDIAVSIKGGADITLEISDIVILNNKLSGLAKSINISQKTFRIIKENLAISLIYNSITIPLAMAGYVLPFVAAISMSISSLLVVGNSMRIKKI